MKHLFIRHIVTSQAYSDATLAERKKWFDEYAKCAKENGLKLIFWGIPYGVPESLTVVLESDKSLDNLDKFGAAWSARLKQLALKGYGATATTTVVIAQE
jgi:hypothetical protein